MIPFVFGSLALVAAIDDADPTGLWLHAAAGAGVVGGDAVVVLEPGVGLETKPFAVHLSLPLDVRVIDFAPTVDPGAPPSCRVFRCEEWLVGDALSADAISRVVDEVRVFHPGDVFHLKGGALFASLGHGALVDEYMNAADWDRRHAGLYAESNLPWGKTQLQAVTGDFLAPQELFAVRASTSPMAARAGGDEVSDEGDAGSRFASRLRLGFEAAGDVTAPIDPADAHGDVVPGSRSRTVGGVAADVTWPLLDDGGFNIAPYAGVAGLTGLAHDGIAGVGGGARAGVDLSLDVVVVALRGGASVTLDGPRHRSGVFDTLYDVDRKRYALSAGSHGSNGVFAANGIANLDATGGVGGDVNLELLVLRVVRAGARLHADPVPEATRAEVYAGVDAGSVRVDARAMQRAFHDVGGAFAFGDRSFVVVDAAWQVWPPVSLFVRWLHGPRFQNGVPQADDDVVVGASFDLVVTPG